MRRLLWWLIQLYPRGWRDRYGEEFLALLEDIEPRWADVWDIGSRGLAVRWKAMKTWQWIFSGALLGLAAHLAFTLHIPDNYSSSGTLRVVGAPFDVDAQEEFRRAVDSSLTEERLLAMMKRHGISAEELTQGREHEAIARFRQQLFVGTGGTGGDQPGLIRFAAWAPDAQRAQRISRDFMTMIVEAKLAGASKLEVADSPALPAVSNRWVHAPWNLTSGLLFGAFCGCILALVQFGWRKLAAKP